jgi:hypothetical protein
LQNLHYTFIYLEKHSVKDSSQSERIQKLANLGMHIILAEMNTNIGILVRENNKKTERKDTKRDSPSYAYDK